MPKVGRPAIFIDLEQAEKLGNLQCTYAECAAFLSKPDVHISEALLKSREDFLTAYKKGSGVGKISLRRTQFRLAETSAAMAIWLGKQYLGQTEKIEVTNTELMREEIELIPSNGGFKGDYRNRIKQFVSNQ